MLRKLRSLLSSGPETHWFVEVTEPGFIHSAQLEEERYKQREDHSHWLTLNFQEPVRDGNDVSHINIRNDEGQIVHQMDLFTGQESAEFGFNPSRNKLSFVAVAADDSAHDTTTVEFYKEQLPDPE